MKIQQWGRIEMLRSGISTFIMAGVVIFHISAGHVSAGDKADLPAVYGDSPVAAYEIVTREAFRALPAPLRSYFETHLEQIQQSTTSFDNNIRVWHYVLLDAAANIDDWEDRLETARQFPRNQKIAQQFFKKNKLQDQGGQLPWVILDHFDRLTQAFQTGSETKITAETASIMHFVTDACWPMNTSAERFDSTPQSQSVTMSRKYLELAVAFDALRERLAYEVRVSPGRYRTISDPSAAVFDELLSSFSALNEIDIAVKNNRNDGRLAQIFEQRLESAAVLAVRLIGTAWENANKPDLSAVVRQITQPNSNTPRIISSPTTAHKFLGSKNSRIFHISTCVHAKRIKPANIVRFDSLDKALKAGRKSCKTCKSASKSP